MLQRLKWQRTSLQDTAAIKSLSQMSAKSVSPTANLLRQSRLFSLPPTLPRPTGSTSTYPSVLATNDSKNSDTATLPYPIQQAIATPASSRAQGDWGVKRSLPLKSTTRTSTPAFRINAVDTREHITDFDSAADLTLTGEKFRELGIPFTVQDHLKGSKKPLFAQSVFEPALDNTDPDVEKAGSTARGGLQRWKFGGPWLASLTQGEFMAYMGSTLRGRKEEFRQFAREKESKRLARIRRFNQRHDMTRSGRRGQENLQDGEDEEPYIMSEEEFDKHLRRLRFELSSDHVGSRLAQLLAEFLDLPLGAKVQHAADAAKNIEQRAPPNLHPSAGLSYLRTDSVLPNHPVLGPMARPAPHQARVLSDVQGGFDSSGQRTKLGLAGFSAFNTPDHSNEKGNKSGSQPRIPVPAERDLPESLDPEKNPRVLSAPDRFVNKEVTSRSTGLFTRGGNKVWVEPIKAQIDEKGRVQLTLWGASREQVAGHRHGGKIEEKHAQHTDTMKRPTAPSFDHEQAPPSLASGVGNAAGNTAGGYGLDGKPIKKKDEFQEFLSPGKR